MGFSKIKFKPINLIFTSYDLYVYILQVKIMYLFINKSSVVINLTSCCFEHSLWKCHPMIKQKSCVGATLTSIPALATPIDRSLPYSTPGCRPDTSHWIWHQLFTGI